MESLIWSIFSFLGTAVFLSPALITLLFIYLGRLRRKTSKVESKGNEVANEKFNSAISYLVISSAISPVIPLLLILSWSKSVGSASGLPLIFILPFAWLFFFLGIYKLISAGVKSLPIDNNP